MKHHSKELKISILNFKYSNLGTVILLLPALSLLYLVHFTVAGIPTNVFEVLIYLLAITAWVIHPAWRKLHRNELMGLALIVVLTGIELLISDQRRTGLGMVKGWIIPALLAYWMVSRSLISKPAFAKLTLGMVAQGFVLAVVTISQRFGVVAHWWAAHYPTTAPYVLFERSVGFFNSPNACAMILAPALVVSLAFLKRKDFWLASLVIAAGLVATGSRAGMIAAISSTLVFWLLQKHAVIKAYAVMVAGVVVFNPITLTLLANRNANDADIRVHIWNKSWLMLLQHQFGGYGLTSFQDHFRAFTLHQINFDEFITPFAVHPHNIFLYTWFLFGILGLLALLYMIVRAFTRIGNNPTLTQAVGAALLVCFLIQGMMDNSLWKNDLIIWFVVALLLCLTPQKSSSDS